MHSYHMLGAGRFPLHHTKRFQDLTLEDWDKLLEEGKQEYLDNEKIVGCSRSFQKAMGRNVDINKCTVVNNNQKRDRCFYTCASCGIRDAELNYNDGQPIFVKDLPEEFVVDEEEVKNLMYVLIFLLMNLVLRKLLILCC